MKKIIKRYIHFIKEIYKRIILRTARIFYIIKGKRCLHFIHIGKTGGTVIKHVLKTSRPSSASYIIFLHGHTIKLKDIPKGDGIIFFLRDPISRFVSGFYSRQRQGKPKYFVPWSPCEEVAFATFNTPEQLALSLTSENEEEKINAQKAMQCIQHVKNSFWEWFESDNYFESRRPDIFFIGFQEQLANDLEKLSEKLCIRDKIYIPRDNTRAHRSPTNLDKTLSPKATENLKR